MASMSEFQKKWLEGSRLYQDLKGDKQSGVRYLHVKARQSLNVFKEAFNMATTVEHRLKSLRSIGIIFLTSAKLFFSLSNSGVLDETDVVVGSSNFSGAFQSFADAIGTPDWGSSVSHDWMMAVHEKLVETATELSSPAVRGSIVRVYWTR